MPYTLTTKDGEEVTFRALTPTDNHKLAAFLAELSPQTRRFCTYDSYDLKMANTFCDAIGKYDKLRFVVENQNQDIVGLFEFSFDLVAEDVSRYLEHGITLNQGSDCRFGPCLSDRYQKKGLGSQLMPFVIQIAKQKNQKRIILWGGVMADNTLAINFYQKYQFKNVGSFINRERIRCYDMILESL